MNQELAAFYRAQEGCRDSFAITAADGSGELGRLSVWDSAEAASLKVQEVVAGKNPQLFSEWAHRAGTPREVARQLIEMFTTASAEAPRAFQVHCEGAEIFFS